jgi:hypothetical protein
MKKVRWKSEPDAHDYPAAASYLALIAGADTAGMLVEGLKVAPIEHAKAKDILRASGLPELPLDNVHVAKEVARVRAGTALSPVLLVSGDIGRGIPLQIVDGYHRVCASCHLAEDTDVPYRIVGLPTSGTTAPASRRLPAAVSEGPPPARRADPA